MTTSKFWKKFFSSFRLIVATQTIVTACLLARAPVSRRFSKQLSLQHDQLSTDHVLMLTVKLSRKHHLQQSFFQTDENNDFCDANLLTLKWSMDDNVHALQSKDTCNFVFYHCLSNTWATLSFFSMKWVHLN